MKKNDLKRRPNGSLVAHWRIELKSKIHADQIRQIESRKEKPSIKSLIGNLI